MRIAIYTILTLWLLTARSFADGTNDPLPSLWSRPTLFGDVAGLRPPLAAHGVNFLPVYTGEIMGEVAGHHGGNRVVYANNLSLPLDIDLDKFAGWHEALFHANAYWLAGRGLTADGIGDLANVSNITGYRTVRLSELWLQQSFRDGQVSLKAGLLAVDTEFFTSDTAALFMSSSFGTFSLIAANLPNPPIYPVAAPAVRLAVQATPRWGIQAGIFDGNSGAQEVNKNGIEFHLAQGDGILIFSEIIFQPQSARDEGALADIFKVGGFFLSSRQPTWMAQTAGLTSGGSGDFGLYAVAEQDLFKSHQKKSLPSSGEGGRLPIAMLSAGILMPA